MSSLPPPQRLSRTLDLLLAGLFLWISATAGAAQQEKGLTGCKLIQSKDPGSLTVSEVIPKSPAAEAGMNVGDSVVAINELPIQTMSFAQVSSIMYGKIGASVSLTLRRQGSEDRQISIVLRSIPDAFLPAALDGDPAAEYYLGYFYDLGPASQRDPASAAEWYRKAALQGIAGAQVSLGYLCETGAGTSRDPKAAAHWYHEAARQGDAIGENRLAYCFLYGEGVEQSDRAAFDWSYSAALQDDPVAEERLGYLYWEGLGVPKNERESFNWYYRAAERGNASAQVFLASLFRSGIGAPKDPATAAHWYLQAAKQGDLDAETEIASCYERGDGVEQSNRDAFNWLYSAALQDDPRAESRLAHDYLKGRGVQKSDREAFNWYYRAAERGNSEGEAGLGYMYAAGRGAKRNSLEALKWYEQARLASPQDEELAKAVALMSMRAFVESPESAPTLDLPFILSVFRRQIFSILIVFAVAYAAGCLTLFYFTFRAGAAPPKLPLALGWMSLFIEGQGVAVFGLFVLGTTLRANTLLGVTALFCALPVIASSCGPGRSRIWKPSRVSWKTLFIYAAGAVLSIALIGVGSERLYVWLTHSQLPAQPTLALITKAKEASISMTYATVSFLFPVAEEIIFRSYLFDALRRRFSGGIVVVLTALTFALIHFQFLYFAPLLAMGLILGWIRLKTDSLRLPVLLHMLNNGISLFI